MTGVGESLSILYWHLLRCQNARRQRPGCIMQYLLREEKFLLIVNCCVAD